MGNFMKRYAMGVSALLVIFIGILAGHVSWLDPDYIILFVILLFWAGVEFFIGLCRSYEGKAPSKLSIRLLRMLWLAFVIYSWLDFRYGWTKAAFPMWFKTLLLGFCIFGLIIRLWSVIHLGGSFSYDLKCPEGKALITSGPYRLIRHPSYLGMCLIATVPALVLGSLVGFAGLAASTVIHTITRVQIEESILEQEFGQVFLDYKQKSYRLIPYVY